MLHLIVSILIYKLSLFNWMIRQIIHLLTRYSAQKWIYI